MRRRIPVWRSLRSIDPLPILGIAGSTPGEPTAPEEAQLVAPPKVNLTTWETFMPGRHSLVFVALLGMILVAGCQDDPTTVPIDPNSAVLPAFDTRVDTHTSESPSIARVAVELSAVGSFRPNTPVVISLLAKANQDAATSHIEVTLLDGVAVSDAPLTSLASRSGALSRGGSHSATVTVSFSEPGYYRVRASGRSTSSSGDDYSTLGDTLWYCQRAIEHSGC